MSSSRYTARAEPLVAAIPIIGNLPRRTDIIGSAGGIASGIFGRIPRSGGSHIVHPNLTGWDSRAPEVSTMIGQLMDLLGGWREVRATMGFSYQIARSGKRRIIPIDGYRTRGTADEQWVASGTFADDGLSERFRDFSYVPPKQRRRERPAKRDFAMKS